ncbi:hypothetical protein CHS0354_004601 [Potamilus streckersoni]|uniref:Transmembrane protein 134 n=1 Tax=Potamilus streckersoni TaxID=2493646 RepID=A0AAE0S4V4_9BIVA|nr:hypothetical protein CHS0354_004601 [Potamilus streckersoni]
MTSDKQFNIDDAFESDDEDRVRLYGSTNVVKAFKGPKVRENDEEEDEDVELAKPNLNGRPTSLLLPATSSRSLNRVNSGDTYVSSKSVSNSTSWLKHPKIRENWRVVCGAFALTIIGSALFLTGVGIVISPQRGMHSLVFFIGGLLCLIPGAYHLVYIFLAVKRFDGYSLYNLPVFR